MGTLKVSLLILLISQSAYGDKIPKPSLHPGELPRLSLCVEEPLSNINPREGFMFVASPGEKITPDLCKKPHPQSHPLGVKLRGFASAKYAKSQYALRFWDQEKKKKDVDFFGLGKSSKWVLKGPFIDLSSMRDTLTYQIGREIGESRNVYFAPKTEYVWVYRNGEAQGLYVLTQKIEPSSDKVPIRTKLPKEETITSDLKEYLVQVSFHTQVVSAKKDPDLAETTNGVQFAYTDPSPKDLLAHPSIKSKILREINELDILLSPKNIEHFPKLYRQKIDFPSLIDYMVVQEFTKNIDAYRRSLYLYKAGDGLFHFGPLWDFDLAYGNAWTNGLHNYHSARGWVFMDRQVGLGVAPWFKQILEKDPSARSAFLERYRELRQPGMPLDWAKIESKIDSMYKALGPYGAVNFLMWFDKRDFKQKTFLSTKLAPKDYGDHVQILKTWIQKRLAWMDTQNEMDLY